MLVLISPLNALASEGRSATRDRHPEVARDREHRRLLRRRIDPDQDHRLRVQPIGGELGIVVRPEQQDREGLGRSLDRIQVRKPWSAGGGGRRRFQQRHEIRSQAGQAREEKSKHDDPDTWHLNLCLLLSSNA